MSAWFYKSLGDAIMAHAPSEKIREAFTAHFQSAGQPADMAVFTRSDSEGRLHCEVTVYFSPASAQIAQAFNALPCDQPLKPGLDLLAGSTSSWTMLFP
jgi:hypothetical protein